MKKIFILEDEKIIGKLYKKRLILEWFSVELAENLKDSKKILENFKPEIAFLDYWLENENWLNLAIFIRENFLETKIIFLSNYEKNQILSKDSEKFFDDFLLKIDFTPKKLAEYLKKI